MTHAPARTQDEQPEGTKKIENYFYRLSDKIGEGNFSQVFRGVDQNTGKSVAVKVIKLSTLTSKVAQVLLTNEVSILRELDHPNVIRCLDVFSSKNNCYIVTEFYGGGDLEKLIYRRKHFHEREISQIVLEVHRGLVYLNQMGIIHRDFKPANVFLDENGSVKIADFGFAVKSALPIKDINIGSPIYMSPEGLINHEYGPKTEVWALGIMVYEMLHGETPLCRCQDQKELKERVAYPPAFREGISEELKSFILACLIPDPKQRPTMKQLIGLPYLSRLIRESDDKNKDLTCTYHTNNSLTKNALEFVKQVKTYEEGLSLLQYCRLVHKTTQEAPSAVLSQWLLNLCWNLQSMRIERGDRAQNEKLLVTLHDYGKKYQREHIDSHLDVTIEDVIAECQAIAAKMRMGIGNSGFSVVISHLNMLQAETELLQKVGESGSLARYAKYTKIEKYLETIQTAKNKISTQVHLYEAN